MEKNVIMTKYQEVIASGFDARIQLLVQKMGDGNYDIDYTKYDLIKYLNDKLPYIPSSMLPSFIIEVNQSIKSSISSALESIGTPQQNFVILQEQKNISESLKGIYKEFDAILLK